MWVQAALRRGQAVFCLFSTLGLHGLFGGLNVQITIEIKDPEQLLAWEKAFATYGMPDDPGWRRAFAHSLICMATDAIATTDHPRPRQWPRGKFDYRPWTDEEYEAFKFLHQLNQSAAKTTKPSHNST